MLKQRVLYSIFFYGLVVGLLLLLRPAAVFDPETGRARPFGVGEGRTLYSLGVLSVALAIATFYIFALVDMIFA
jgi:hypothetical protein